MINLQDIQPGKWVNINTSLRERIGTLNEDVVKNPVFILGSETLGKEKRCLILDQQSNLLHWIDCRGTIFCCYGTIVGRFGGKNDPTLYSAKIVNISFDSVIQTPSTELILKIAQEYRTRFLRDSPEKKSSFF